MILTKNAPARRTGRGALKMCGVLALAAALGGCATNMTGFDFPVFGLTKKADDGRGGSGLGPEYQPSSHLSHN